MTYIYRNPVSMERDHARGGERHVNIWKGHAWQGLQAGDRHWTREDADRAVDNAKFETPRPKCLYRVVVRFK